MLDKNQKRQTKTKQYQLYSYSSIKYWGKNSVYNSKTKLDTQAS